nr:XrtB/PEP-CTERM-associated polysaccharide biosynthesis outer membrane protein EpsL [uncultured Rhodoferax sp.]
MRAQPTLHVAVALCACASAAAAQEAPLVLTAGYTVQTDSNLFRLPSSANTQALIGKDSAAEKIGVTTVGFGLNTYQSLQKFEFDLNLVDYKYQNFNYLSFTASNYNAAWRWALTPALTGSLTSSRKETLNSFSDFNSYTQRNQRIDTSTGLNAEYQLDGTWRLLGGISTTRQANQQAVLAGSDYTSNTANAGVKYAFASGSSISYVARLGSGSYLNRTVPNAGQFDDSFKQFDNDLRLRWALGGNSNAELYLTHINRTHPTYGQRDYNGFNTGASLDWAISGKTALNVGFSHALDAYATANSNYSQTDKISIGPVWQFSPKAALRLRYDWAQRDYLGSPGATASTRRDTTRDTSVSINWQPYQQLALSAALQGASRGSNQTGLDYDSTQLLFTAQLTY